MMLTMGSESSGVASARSDEVRTSARLEAMSMQASSMMTMEAPKWSSLQLEPMSQATSDDEKSNLET